MKMLSRDRFDFFDLFFKFFEEERIIILAFRGLNQLTSVTRQIRGHSTLRD